MSRVLLIKNANLYDPDPKGIRDILIVDEKVFSVAEHIDPPELSAPVDVVSADGKMVIPGYVDQHVHVIGGGGAKLLVTRLSGGKSHPHQRGEPGQSQRIIPEKGLHPSGQRRGSCDPG